MSTWRDALTSDELKLFREAGYGRRVGFGNRPAALVIDVEYSFTGATPEPVFLAIRRSRYSCGDRAWQCFPAIQRFLEAVRLAKVPIFYTHGISEDGQPGLSRGGAG